jgi:hypothetical protein
VKDLGVRILEISRKGTQELNFGDQIDLACLRGLPFEVRRNSVNPSSAHLHVKLGAEFAVIATFVFSMD